MIIDIHSHVYAFPRIKPSACATTFMSAAQQIAMMDSKGVDKAVILPLNNPESPAEPQSMGEIMYICDKYPGRFIPFCNLDPRLPKRKDLITVEDFDFRIKQYAQLGCKGLGELTCRIQWLDSSMLMLLEACQRYEFCVTFHTITEDFDGYGIIDEIGLPGLEGVLARFPKLKFLGHSPGFWSEISGDVSSKDKNGYPTDKVAAGGRLKNLMRKYPNIYGDISANSGLYALKRDLEHAYEFIEEFQDRLLLGLDYCSVENDMQHIEWLTNAMLSGHISRRAYDKITSENAYRILHLS